MKAIFPMCGVCLYLSTSSNPHPTLAFQGSGFVMAVILLAAHEDATARPKTHEGQPRYEALLWLPHPSSAKAVPAAPCHTYRRVPADGEDAVLQTVVGGSSWTSAAPAI
jgi:hypothetical protein